LAGNRSGKNQNDPPAAEGSEPSGTEHLERILELELTVRALERQMEQRSREALHNGIQQGLEQGRQQGHQQGHQQGLQQGLTQGLEQGRQEGDATARQELAAQVEGQMQKLSRTIEEISGLRQRFRHEAEEDVVQLALAIARRVLHRELTIDPGAMLGLVKVALDQLDVREIHRLRVHPDQAAPLQASFERMGLPRRLQVEADPSLERGAALFETTRGTLDASAETQLAEIERGFTDLVRHVK
jgi:flagellar assembly protein FliH